MFSMIGGAALVVLSVATYFYLLPRNRQEHPFVKDSNVGSMITIALMTGLRFGLLMMFAGFIN